MKDERKVTVWRRRRSREQVREDTVRRKLEKTEELKKRELVKKVIERIKEKIDKLR